MKSGWRTKAVLSTLIAGIALGQGGSISFAQTPRPGAAAGKGLDGVATPGRLAELSSRGLNTLLNKAFDVYKVPEAEKNGLLAMLGRRG